MQDNVKRFSLIRAVVTVQLAFAKPDRCRRTAQRFLQRQPLPFPNVAACDRNLFVLEAARAGLVDEALRVSTTRFRFYPLQLIRFIRANLYLWLVVKAVEAVDTNRGANR